MMIIIHSLTNNEPVSISAVLFIYSFFYILHYISFSSSCALLSLSLPSNEGPKTLNASPRWNNCGRTLSSQPEEKSISVTRGLKHLQKKKREGENNFCLWFMVSASGTLLVDSLNCPSRAKHTPLKKSIHTSLCVCLCFFSPLCAKSMCFYGVSLSIMKENDEEYHITLPRQA